MKTPTPERSAQKYYVNSTSILYSYSGYYCYSKQSTLNTGYNYTYDKNDPGKVFFKRYLL